MREDLIWDEIFLCRDPNGAMYSFYDMMKKQIVMPAHLMDDSEHVQKTGRNLFKDFSSVAQTTGTYTAQASQISQNANLFIWLW